MLALLAQSLTQPQQPSLHVPHQPAADAPPTAPHLPPLCQYVLSTFVRRSLERAHIAHVSNERAAVNAIRFVEVRPWEGCGGNSQDLGEG